MADATPERARPSQREDSRAVVAAQRGALGLALSGVRAVAMGGFTFAAMQVAQLHLRTQAPDARDALRQVWVKRWARGLLVVFGVRQQLSSAAATPATRARLVVANHRSPIDILLMLEHFGGCVLSHAGVARWPVLGAAAREGGTIFVDRDDRRSGAKAIREIRRRLSDGQTVIVFPEGTTFEGDEVRAFLGGAFAAIRGIDAEVVPVGIAYESGAEFVNESFTEHVTRVARRPRTRVGLCIGAPVGPGTDREQLALALQATVQSLVVRARGALAG